MKRRADGRFVAVHKYKRLDGTEDRKWFYGYTEKEVRDKIAEFKYELKAGRFFKEVATEWKEEHFPTLEYNTLKPYRPALQRAIDEFGEYRISEVTAPMINAYIQRFAKKGYARKTVAHQLMVLNMIFARAAVGGEILHNPVESISVPKGLKKTRRELPPDEELEIIKRSLDKPFGLFAYFILYTGLRKGEALALTYGDIDRQKKRITVNKSVYHDSNKAKIKIPKTEAGTRTVILLDRLLLNLPEGRPKELLFPGEDGMMRHDEYNRAWAEYQKETGITCTAHQLRHAFATFLYEKNIPEKDAQEMMGHANISTLRDIYTHISKSRQDYIADLLNDDLA